MFSFLNYESVCILDISNRINVIIFKMILESKIKEGDQKIKCE